MRLRSFLRGALGGIFQGEGGGEVLDLVADDEEVFDSVFLVVEGDLRGLSADVIADELDEAGA